MPVKNRYPQILLHIASFVLVVSSCVAVYWGTFQVPFVFDDLYRIVNNPDIRGFDRFISWSFFLEQRPLVDLTFAFNYHFGGINVWGYHLVNLLIHIANGILVYILTLTIFKRLGSLDARFQVNYAVALALLAALIFSVHPLQTQAVTYISQRYTSLAALFYLLSVLCYIYGRTSQLSAANQSGIMRNLSPGLLFVLCFVSGLAAFLSKQNAISLPLVILFMEYALFDRTWSGWRIKLKWMAPLAGAFMIFVLAGAGLFKGELSLARLFEDFSALSRETDSVGRFQYLVTQFAVLLVYLRLLLWPAGQSLDYMYPFVQGFSWISFSGFLVLLGLIFAVVFFLRRMPLVSLGIFWMLAALSVESGIIPINDALVEHRLYLPMVGFVWVVSAVLVKLVRKPAIYLPAGFALVLVFSVVSIERNKVWQSSLSLWSDVVDKHPHNHRARFNLGNALREKQSLTEAERQYLIALDLREDYAQTHYNLGLTYQAREMPMEALKHFQAAVEIRPAYVQALVNMAVVLEGLGRVVEAFESINAAYGIRPDDPAINYNLGFLYLRSQRPEKAEKYILRAKNAGHRPVEVGFVLGNIYFDQNRIQEAREQYEEVLALRPDHPGALFNLGNTYLKTGDLREAVIKYYKALEFDPGFARGHFHLGRILVVLDQKEQALHHFIRAVELDPDFTEARQELIRVLGQD